MTNSKVNLLGLSRKMLRDYLLSIGEKPFRGDQIMKWIYHAGASDFSEMTDVSKALRERLTEIAEIRAPEVIREQRSKDGTIKWALDVGDGQAVETVYIPEDDRATLCISTQVGCPMGCRFCSTGLQGSTETSRQPRLSARCGAQSAFSASREERTRGQYRTL